MDNRADPIEIGRIDAASEGVGRAPMFSSKRSAALMSGSIEHDACAARRERRQAEPQAAVFLIGEKSIS
jgi:hypothetical protein